MGTEFDEWAERFEPWILQAGWPNSKRMPAKCMYPVKEGPHKRAHLVEADSRSPDNYPVCSVHKNKKVRPAWRGYVDGA